jgi:S-adenosylmethionine decarboxylase
VAATSSEEFSPRGKKFLRWGPAALYFARFVSAEQSGVPRKFVFRPPLSSWVGAAAMARFGVNAFGRVGARMARLEHGVTAIKGARALNVRVPARTVPVPIPEGDADSKDHFITKNGVTFAGSHLIIDFWEAEGLDSKDRIEQAMIDAVEAAGATLLHIHLHTFTPSGGVSGVAVLAESHISVHTWPERGYAAFDVFMCGSTDTRKALSVLKQAFAPKRVVLGEHKRGVL